MKKYIIIFSAVVIALVIVVTLFLVKNKSQKTPPAAVYSEQNQPDVYEGAPINYSGVQSNSLDTDPWSKDLPYFGQYYDIYYLSHNKVKIDVPNASSAIGARFKQEALDWLKTQGAPVDQLIVVLE